MTSAKLGPITAGWREYRETAVPRSASPTYLKASRLAYYAAASHVLAAIVPKIPPGGVDEAAVACIAEMAAELDLFLAEHREDVS